MTLTTNTVALTLALLGLASLLNLPLAGPLCAAALACSLAQESPMTRAAPFTQAEIARA